jgi:hypothetical protein
MSEICIMKHCIGGVMVSVLDSSVVDHVFIGGVMVSVLDSSVVDHWWCNG